MASLLEGLRKEAVLEMVIPGVYGFYAKGKGVDPKKTAIRGALIGGGINTFKALGKLSKGEAEAKDALAPFTGAALGAGFAFGIYKARPAIKKFVQKEKKWAKIKEKVKELVEKI